MQRGAWQDGEVPRASALTSFKRMVRIGAARAPRAREWPCSRRRGLLGVAGPTTTVTWQCDSRRQRSFLLATRSILTIARSTDLSSTGSSCPISTELLLSMSGRTRDITERWHSRVVRRKLSHSSQRLRTSGTWRRRLHRSPLRPRRGERRRLAVGTADGVATLSLSGSSWGHSILAPVGGEVVGTEQVEVVSLASVLEEFTSDAPRPPVIVKVNIEGMAGGLVVGTPQTSGVVSARSGSIWSQTIRYLSGRSWRTFRWQAGAA